MRAGMRRWTLRAGRCVCALTVIAASIAEAQQGSIGGVVTDQATGQAARGRPGDPHRPRPHRDHQPGRAIPVPQRGAGQLPGPGAPAGLPAGDRQPRTWRRARRSRSTSRMTPRPGAARRDRDHGHRRAAQARGRQRGRDHRRGADRRGVADHRVRQPALGPRGGRAGAQRAAAPPAPAPASGSAAPTASRSPTSRCTTSTGSGWRAAPSSTTLDIGGFGQGAGAGARRASTTSIPRTSSPSRS